MPVRMYGSETIIWKEEERARIRVVQMDKIRSLLGIRRMDRVPNARIRELCGMAKGVDERIKRKIFSIGLVTWKGWKMTGLLRGSM